MKLKKNETVEITFDISDEEIIQLLVDKTIDERVVFFRKLFETDIKNIFTLKFIKQFI